MSVYILFIQVDKLCLSDNQLFGGIQCKYHIREVQHTHVHVCDPYGTYALLDYLLYRLRGKDILLGHI